MVKTILSCKLFLSAAARDVYKMRLFLCALFQMWFSAVAPTKATAL